MPLAAVAAVVLMLSDGKKMHVRRTQLRPHRPLLETAVSTAGLIAIWLSGADGAIDLQDRNTTLGRQLRRVDAARQEGDGYETRTILIGAGIAISLAVAAVTVLHVMISSDSESDDDGYTYKRSKSRRKVVRYSGNRDQKSYKKWYDNLKKRCVERGLAVLLLEGSITNPDGPTAEEMLTR